MSRGQLLLIIGAIVGGASVLFFILYYSGDAATRTELNKEIAKTLLNVVFVGIAAMSAKALVDEYVKAKHDRLKQARRREADERADHALRLQALSALTTGYWNAKKALKIIEAHRSARSYGEQIRAVLDHRLELQQLDNEISAKGYPLQDTDAIHCELKRIDDQLGLVIDEWRDRYLELAQLQVLDEKLPPAEKRVPGAIDCLEQLAAVRADGFAALHDPFERAANIIRAQVFRTDASLASSPRLEFAQPAGLSTHEAGAAETNVPVRST